MAEPLTLAESMEFQAKACATSGSEIYASLLNGLLVDYLAGGVTAEVLEGLSDRPLNDAIALRLLAVGHRIALRGDAPELARFYPSCGGEWDGRDITDVFLSTVTRHRGEVVRGVLEGVQTNEVGRAPVLVSAFALLARRHRLPFDMREVGSSAGLISRWDHYFYDTGDSQLGDPASPLQFGPEWWKGPKPALDGPVSVRSKRGCDIAPIDLSDEEGRLKMLSFLWPDQLERFTRLRAALDVAAANPFSIDQGDAGDWLGEQLREGPAQGAVTIVFHSIVWQYLPKDTRNGVRAALASAGAKSSPSAVLAWVRMEPATPEFADVRVTTWPSGEEELLAQVGYHGADIRWVAPV